MKKYARRKTKGKSSFKKRSARLVRAIRPEHKHYDVFNTHSIISTGTLTLLSGVTTLGADDNQRIADTIYVTSLYLRMTLSRSTTSDYDNIRIIVLQDLMGYNVPAVNDIMEPFPMGTAYAPSAQRNHYYLSRFRILWDTTVTMTLNLGVGKHLKKNIRVNRRLEYVGASTFKNQIWLLTIGDNNNALTLPIIKTASRIIYTDV